MKLLQVDSSILGAASASRTVTAAIVDALRRSDPSIEIVSRDLAAEPVPHLLASHLPGDHPVTAAIGIEQEARDQQAESRAVLDEFLSADIVVIGAPMYNFALPSQLKAWIDRLIIPGKTFHYTEQGPKGLAGDKRVIIAVTRGGIYAPGTPAAGAEHVESYLRAIFGFIGISPEVIVAEGLAIGPEQRADAMSAALGAAAGMKS